jgi:hypothetical protein
MIIEALLLVILFLLVEVLWRQHRQQQELMEWLDAVAEMIGEAMDKMGVWRE